MRPILILLFFAQWAGAAEPGTPDREPHQARPGPAQTAELTASISQLDQTLFGAIFDHCDSEALRPLVADDLEFFHDKHGQTASSGTQFVETIAGMCARQATGEDYRARRELVAGTSQVYPMQGYGALHTGVHRFYMLEPGKPERLVETGRFANLWQFGADGQWRLSRVLSYDHRTTD
ncbi:MAG: nuclear transport factor 2 family protein [Rhodanobacteraceae bacterium]|nr:nuclear transport factor 2 family protein [Rhodanobacteraceae bacterium]